MGYSIGGKFNVKNTTKGSGTQRGLSNGEHSALGYEMIDSIIMSGKPGIEYLLADWLD